MTSPAELMELGVSSPGERALWSAIAGGRPFRAGPPPLGPSAAELGRLHREGVLTLLVGDVYVPADADCTPSVRADAAALVVPPGAVLAGVAAAWVHGVGPGPLAGVCGDPAVDVISPPGLVPRPKSRDWLRVRQFSLEDGDHVRLGGLRVTTPVRTAVDLGRVLPAPLAAELFGRLAAATGLEVTAVQARIRRMAGRSGVGAAKRMLDAWRAGSETGP